MQHNLYNIWAEEALDPFVVVYFGKNKDKSWSHLLFALLAVGSRRLSSFPPSNRPWQPGVVFLPQARLTSSSCAPQYSFKKVCNYFHAEDEVLFKKKHFQVYVWKPHYNSRVLCNKKAEFYIFTTNVKKSYEALLPTKTLERNSSQETRKIIWQMEHLPYYFRFCSLFVFMKSTTKW